MRTVIITGANSGLGLNTGIRIARASDEYRLILACRNAAKAEAARQEIIEKSRNKNVETMELDVASLASVRSYGLYYDRSVNAVRSSDLSYNEEYARELWETSECYVKEYLSWTS